MSCIVCTNINRQTRLYKYSLGYTTFGRERYTTPQGTVLLKNLRNT